MTDRLHEILKGEIVARIGLQKGIKKADPKRYPFLFFYIGRVDPPQIRKEIPNFFLG